MVMVLWAKVGRKLQNWIFEGICRLSGMFMSLVLIIVVFSS